MDESIGGICVHRCKHYAMRDNIILRGFEHFLLPIYYYGKYVKLSKKFDVILMYIPPLPLYYLAKKIKKYDGTPSVLNYQDFHPQELTDVGMMKNRAIIGFMKYLEKSSYKNADYITVLSEGGVDYVVNKGGDRDKIRHVYNGCLLSDLEKYMSKKDFKVKEGIADKLLISYAGILSPFQGIDNILNAAKDFVDQDDIIFFIVGDGSIKSHLEDRINKEKLRNVKMLPLQPREEYFNIINSTDISIISLDNRMKAPCLPGKTINLMAFRQPLIAIVPEDSETDNLIKKANCGICVVPDNPLMLRNAIVSLHENPQIRKQLGANGRAFVEEYMDLNICVNNYEGIFNKIIKRSNSYGQYSGSS